MRKVIAIVCSVVALTFVLVLVVVALSYNGPTTTSTEQPTSSTQDQDPRKSKEEAEMITLQEWGFEPREINRPAGPFVAVFENHSGLREVQLSLIRESGQSMVRIPVTRNALNSRQRLTLPPGTYLVKEANHPEWQCRIVITAR